MSDQQAPPNGDSPAVAGPTEAPGTAQDQQAQGTPGQEVNWEQRYTDTQADYTRQQQELAQLKQEREWALAALTTDDPDTYRQAAEILGIEAPDDDTFDDEGFEEATEDEQYMTRAEFEEFRRQEQQQVQEAMEMEFIADRAKAELEELGLVEGKHDKARLMVFNYAYGLPRLPPQPGGPRQGLLDIKTAVAELQALPDEMGWQRPRPRAPYVAPGGSAANEVPNSGTGHNARMERASRFLFNNQGDE